MLDNLLPGKKTYIVIIGGLLIVAGGFLTGDMDIAAVVNQVVLLLGLGGLRIAQKTS